MVDVERVIALLRRLDVEVGYLRARAAQDRVALRADEERLSGLKYRFITALETLINIAQHLCASEGWGPPESNADSVRLLGATGSPTAIWRDGLPSRWDSATSSSTSTPRWTTTEWSLTSTTSGISCASSRRRLAGSTPSGVDA